MLSIALKRPGDIASALPRPLAGTVSRTVARANDLLEAQNATLTAIVQVEVAEPAFLRSRSIESTPSGRTDTGVAEVAKLGPTDNEVLARAAEAARRLHDEVVAPGAPTAAAPAPTPAAAPEQPSAAMHPAPAAPSRAEVVEPEAATVTPEQPGVDAQQGAPSIAPDDETADAPLLMPAPPSEPSPATKSRIGGVQQRAGGSASAHQALPAGNDQVSEARAAVTPPTAERAAEAQAELIALVRAAPSPEIVALCERIREVIRNKRPPDEDALMKAEPAREALEAGNQLNGTVSSETQKVQSNYGPVNDAPAVAPAPAAQGLTGSPDVAPTAPINATVATPDAVPDANVSLDQDAAASRQKAVDAGMDSEPARLVQSGPIAETREAQGELDQVAQEDPAKVLARQKEALGKAEGDMAQLQARALGALIAARTKTANDNSKHQESMVGSEEQMRAQAGAEASRIFQVAQTQVNDQLRDLPATAMTEWDAAKDLLVSNFKADLAPVQRRIDERHSGASGFVVGLWDAVTGLPDWAEEGYARAETNFGDGVIAKLTAISTKVNAVIAVCDLIIKTARDDIKSVFARLPASLSEWAAEQQRKFDADLDQLHAKVIKTRDTFDKDLIGASSAAVDEVRAEIAALRKKAAGLVGRIVAAVERFIDDPVKFIIEGLLELLGIPPAAFWAVVARIQQVVSDIADDPMRFANNLVGGLGAGFARFFDNFGTHMLRGFLGWLLGDLKDVAIPKDASLKSVITFFLQLMGITWPNIRKILVDKIGAKNVALIEKAYSVVAMLVEQGPEGIFEMIRQRLDPQAIVDQVVSMAVDYMVTAIAKVAAVRIAMLFNPAGAILQALEAIYRVLKWVFQNAARIFALVQTVVNGIADIIAGNIGGFAKAVETGLEMLIAPVLGFIADYFSLGDLPGIVAEKIKSMRKWILGIIEKVIDWLIAKGKALLAAVGLGPKEKDKDKKKKPGEDDTLGEKVSFQAGDESHQLWIDVSNDNATVMVASEIMPAKAFLASNQVREAATSGSNVETYVNQADAALKQLDKEADAAAKMDGDEQVDAKTKAKARVIAEEKALAPLMGAVMFELVKATEPIAGIHGTLDSVSSSKRESHHVPAKAMGSALVEFVGDIAKVLQKDTWRDNNHARDLAAKLRAKARDINTLSASPAARLSAISLPYAVHKGDAGVHSSSSAQILAEMSKNPAEAAILVCKRRTERELAGYVSVNPSIPSWRGFLIDVRRRAADATFRTDLKTGRDESVGSHKILKRGDVAIILEQAEEGFKKAELTGNRYLDTVVGLINETLASAPRYAFDAGRGIVSSAMDRTVASGKSVGTPGGRGAALIDLERYFLTSWADVEKAVEIEDDV